MINVIEKTRHATRQNTNDFLEQIIILYCFKFKTNVVYADVDAITFWSHID